jgi:glycosyltransferase involved in cell wall biosynthesis
LIPHVLCIGGEDHELRIPFMRALCAEGFRVTAAGTGDSATFERAGLDYHKFYFDRFINPIADWKAVRTIRELLVNVRAELVQSFDTKPNLLVPLAARRVRGVSVIRTINGLGWIYSSRSPLALMLCPIYRTLHRVAARSTAVTIFQNQDDHAFFKQHGMLGDGGGRLIPGSGIDIESFDRAVVAGPSRSELRRSLGLGNAEVVITVSRVTRQKGIRTLMDAAALVHTTRPGVRFLLVGPRQSEGRLAIRQAEIDRHAPYVMAIGRRSDIPALLGAADVFAFPSEYREGVPRALLEAGLAGLPIVTTRMPGCCDVVRDGWNGFLVTPRSPEMLAARIVDLLRDRNRARTMAARTSDLVRQRFNLRITVARYAATYSELADHRGKRRRPSGANGLGTQDLSSGRT